MAQDLNTENEVKKNKRISAKKLIVKIYSNMILTISLFFQK